MLCLVYCCVISGHFCHCEVLVCWVRIHFFFEARGMGTGVELLQGPRGCWGGLHF
jgi:hypothetical protein